MDGNVKMESRCTIITENDHCIILDCNGPIASVMRGEFLCASHVEERGYAVITVDSYGDEDGR